MLSLQRGALPLAPRLCPSWRPSREEQGERDGQALQHGVSPERLAGPHGLGRAIRRVERDGAPAGNRRHTIWAPPAR